jgi:uncharacterized membrane protein
MVTVFIPSSPTAFSGYVLVVPRKGIIELPLQVDEVMQMLVSGGVIVPTGKRQDVMAAAGSLEIPQAGGLVDPQAAGGLKT